MNTRLMMAKDTKMAGRFAEAFAGSHLGRVFQQLEFILQIQHSFDNLKEVQMYNTIDSTSQISSSKPISRSRLYPQ
jgi:hypothetical protein